MRTLDIDDRVFDTACLALAESDSANMRAQVAAGRLVVYGSELLAIAMTSR